VEITEIQQLLIDEFDVEYHPDYLGKFLRDLGLSYAKPRSKRPSRPENPDEIIEERVASPSQHAIPTGKTDHIQFITLSSLFRTALSAPH
jgi:hypothetical protein